MRKTFKVNKEEIVKRLSEVEDVVAINMNIPDIIESGWEITVYVLWKPTNKVGETSLTKTVELTDKVSDLLGDSNEGVCLTIHATECPGIFYEDGIGNDINEGIIRVNRK